MPQFAQNVVQAEFFHVGGDLDMSLSALMKQCDDRILIGAPIKTVVRFFDEGNFVTDYVRREERLVEERNALVYKYPKTQGFEKILTYLQLEFMFRRSGGSGTLPLLAEQVAAIAETTGMLAVEESDHTFRPVCDNEVYDLKTSVSRAKGAWAFLFKPNDLLANENKIIGHLL